MLIVLFQTRYHILQYKRNMLKTTRYHLLLILLGIVGLASCEHEISFDYPPADTMVVFDGVISNEGVNIRISHTRAIGEKELSQPVSNAQVWIVTDDGKEEQLAYDEQKGAYTSVAGLVGIPGHKYQMKAILDGHHYEASSTMQEAVTIDTVFFRSVKLLSERMFLYCVKGLDPRQDSRLYYLCKLMRGDKVFRWNPRSGRSVIDGVFEYDIICSSERDMDKGIDDDGKVPLMEGDTIRMELLTIDRESWDFYQSLMASELTTANPLSNVKGGAMGVFVAAGITRPDTIIFEKSKALN